MKLEEDYRKDELLEMLGHLSEKHDLTLSVLKKNDPTKELEKSLYEFASDNILNFDGTNIHLTEKGREMANAVLRRHRLAERLMVDVLRKKPFEAEEVACEFEHILAPELVDSICIVLGHPKNCPHGSPIPPGKCCLEAQSSVESAVIPLTKMKVGNQAKIASVNTKEDGRMHKMLAIGLTPGTEIKLHQTYPAFVVEVDKRQIALEESVGEDINVWKPLDAG